MHKAIKSIQRMRKKEPLVLDREDGITTDLERPAEIVTDFKDMFQSINMQKIEDVPSIKMSKKFTDTDKSSNQEPKG